MINATVRLYATSDLPIYGAFRDLRVPSTAFGRVVGRVPYRPHLYLVKFFWEEHHLHNFTPIVEVHEQEMEVVTV